MQWNTTAQVDYHTYLGGGGGGGDGGGYGGRSVRTDPRYDESLMAPTIICTMELPYRTTDDPNKVSETGDGFPTSSIWVRMSPDTWNV